MIPTTLLTDLETLAREHLIQMVVEKPHFERSVEMLTALLTTVAMQTQNKVANMVRESALTENEAGSIGRAILIEVAKGIRAMDKP